MGRLLSGLVVALVLAASSIVAAQENKTSKVTLTRDGAPAAKVPVHVRLTNGSNLLVGTTGLAGDLQFALSPEVQNKLARVQVLVYDCGNGEYELVFMEVGAEAEDKNCKRSILGLFRGGQSYAIDLTGKTVQTTGGQKFLRTRNGKLAVGAGVVAAGAVALITTGGDNNANNDTPSNTFNPSGNYSVTISVLSDPGEHRFGVGMESSTVLTVTVNGSNITITCPPGSKLTLINGTINTSTGQINGEGRGPAAGFSNVLFRVAGTLAMSGSNRGTLTLVLTIGPNGELAGGPPITFNVSGTKQ